MQCTWYIGPRPAVTSGMTNYHVRMLVLHIFLEKFASMFEDGKSLEDMLIMNHIL